MTRRAFFWSGAEFPGIAIWDVTVPEGLGVEGVVRAHSPEPVGKFFVVRAGDLRAAGTFAELGVVLRRSASEVRTIGLFFVPGIFGAAMGPVLFRAAECVGIGASG